MSCKLTEWICVECASKFITRNFKPKYCSRKCFNIRLKRDHPFKGKHHSDESKKIISENSKSQKNRNISGLISLEARKRASDFCKAKKGKPNPVVRAFQLAHPSKVKTWHIRSPSGQEYKIWNLKRWVINHPDYFEHAKRAYTGISKLGCNSKWTLPTSWRGWTLISKSEKEDLLNRQITPSCLRDSV